jgi:hypothetical protein
MDEDSNGKREAQTALDWQIHKSEYSRKLDSCSLLTCPQIFIARKFDPSSIHLVDSWNLNSDNVDH